MILAFLEGLAQTGPIQRLRLTADAGLGYCATELLKVDGGVASVNALRVSISPRMISPECSGLAISGLGLDFYRSDERPRSGAAPRKDRHFPLKFEKPSLPSTYYRTTTSSLTLKDLGATRSGDDAVRRRLV